MSHDSRRRIQETQESSPTQSRTHKGPRDSTPRGWTGKDSPSSIHLTSTQPPPSPSLVPGPTPDRLCSRLLGRLRPPTSSILCPRLRSCRERFDPLETVQRSVKTVNQRSGRFIPISTTEEGSILTILLPFLTGYTPIK